MHSLFALQTWYFNEQTFWNLQSLTVLNGVPATVTQVKSLFCFLELQGQCDYSRAWTASPTLGPPGHGERIREHIQSPRSPHNYRCRQRQEPREPCSIKLASYQNQPGRCLFGKWIDLTSPLGSVWRWGVIWSTLPCAWPLHHLPHTNEPSYSGGEHGARLA